MQSRKSSPESQFLRLREVIAQTTLSRSTIYRAVERGDFPQPIKMTASTRAWDQREVSTWMADQMAARDRR